MAPGILVSPSFVAERLAELRVLDVRGEVAAAEPRYRAHPDLYRAGHVPGAVFVDWRSDFTDRDDPVPVQLAPPDAFAADAARLGIGAGTTVVAYDDYRNVLAGRVVWALRAYGHERAHVLDGGLAAWRRAGGALEAGEVTPPRAEPPLVPRRRALLLSLEDVLAAVESGEQLVDARAAAEYAGEETHARRGGHIPGALNVPYRELLGPDGRFRTPGELRRLLEDAGVDLGRPVVAYCNGGVSATAVAYAVELAGGRRAAVYDGSWNEWGNRDDVPVETGRPHAEAGA